MELYQLLFRRQTFQSGNHMCKPVLDPFQNIFMFTVMRTPSCSTIFQMRSNKRLAKFDQYIFLLIHYRLINSTQYFISFIICL